MRLAGKIKDERHIRLSGLEDAVTREKLYRKEQKRIAAVGKAAGLDVEKGAVMHGGDVDDRAEAWAQAIALAHPEGTPDNERMRSFVGLSSLVKDSGARDLEDLVTEDMQILSGGGIELNVALRPAEERLNNAVASLGSRKGDPVDEIANSLRAALHARYVDLPEDDVKGISAELARGAEVVVQIISDDEPESRDW